MFNKKFISIGIIAVVVLAIIYLGNIAMRTTPEGNAGSTYQYKVVVLRTYCGEEFFDAKEGKNAVDCLEKTLNDMAQEGWEYDDSPSDSTTGYYGVTIFRKK